MARKPSRRGSRVVSVDFTDVEIGGGAVHIKEGDYLFKVDKADKDVSESSGDDMIVVQAVGQEKAAKGKRFYLYFSLTPQALWKLGGFLETIGIEVPKEAMDIDLDELVEAEFMGTVEDDSYRKGGKDVVVSKIKEFYSADDGEKEEPEERTSRRSRREEPEEKEERTSRRSRAAREEPEEKEERTSRRSRREEPEEEERHPRSARANGRKPPKLASSEVKDMDEEELEGIVKRYDLDVDLDKEKTPRRKVSAVLTALEDGGMLAD